MTLPKSRIFSPVVLSFLQGRAVIGRWPFFLAAVTLVGIKFAIDLFFDHLRGDPWSWTDLVGHRLVRNYVWQSFDLPMDQPVLLVMRALIGALFAYAGVMTVIGRLRSAGLKLGWVLLFFVPAIKLLFFAILCALPHRPIDPASESNAPGRLRKIRWMPESEWAASLISVGMVAVVSVLLITFGTQLLTDYGWSLFVGIPFLLGFSSGFLFNLSHDRSISSTLTVAGLTLAVAGSALLVIAAEGFICLIMALPLALPLACIGAVAAHAMVNTVRFARNRNQVLSVAFLAMPGTMVVEHGAAVPAPLLKVVTAVEINASPETVWKNVVAFGDLPPPTEWVFKTGVAYPVRATIVGKGVGAVRHCEFSTGPFVEPITTWIEPRLLQFDVTSNPAPLEEWTPYHHIHPKHLDGYLQSHRGQFLLTELPGGRTRLEGTTWYQHHLWPVDYWQVWSDGIIHTIHGRVLNHIKNLAEKESAMAR